LRKLNEPEVREQYQIKITNRFAALENVNDDINRTWENITEKIQTSAEESLCMFFWIKGSRLKCSEYRIQAKAV